ncbi:UNVERIFIED_CONTAM: hypothetical protein FKN15_004901 [Acipenser sinensis]
MHIKEKSRDLNMESKTSQSKSISLSERTEQYPPGVLYTDGYNLFCTACNLSLDHTRKSTIDRHLSSEKHRKRKAEIDSYETVASSKKRKGNENYERRFDLTEAFVCANITLEKIDNPKLCAFLKKHVINAGLGNNSYSSSTEKGISTPDC